MQLTKKYRAKQPPEPDLLSVPEAGALLGLSARSAYRAAQRGEIPGVARLGRKLVVWMPEFRKTFPRGEAS